jgi:hypothetical protein
VNNMLVSYLQLLAAIIIFSCIAIYGSGKRSTDVSVQSTAIDKNIKEMKSIDEKDSQMGSEKRAHQQHTFVKPGAAVSLKNTEPLYASVPGIYEYQLQLLSANHDGKMTVDVSTSDGLAIVSSAHHFEFELQEGSEYRVPLTINASSEGRFYIQLHVSITANGQPSSRVIAAILQVGALAVKAQKAATVKSASQEAGTVISLPAQETISPR